MAVEMAICNSFDTNTNLDAVDTQIIFMRKIVLNDPDRHFLLFLGTAQSGVAEIYPK